MRLPDEPDNIAQINIVPLIDVVFAILTFFIISSLSLSKSEGLPVNLPKAATSQVQESPSKITVTLDAQGKLMVDKKSVNLDQIESTVRQVMGSNPSSLIVLNADKSVNHGNVVEVMDRLRRIKGAKLGIATTK
ncbi:MAG: biopolymer transporter ExbD [Oscillatoriales cyanobacterium]|uniref:ExbD/TolR family protein n=1 Tax=unclassified Microcoleus TaxID=2642155 RepID=UPI001DE4638E|nr:MULTISPECIES: biopolymer transporter ExbD [unclassified Microcoleus]TAG08070.1 MAG: biopolymer transporter ExbD [Oscillatoriales cyanobacterium]MCC3433988.1 biopolymer transporter ExbD [Microcoleus sp. PH2017_05_CCC_O_A]MCC3583531.1 biopolymer transporter ExbD [Microcoleus sp. PH2017_30_WIL_O_A]TAG17517.1 MAG: biopolymer transporter ExbD [Oscillatoriales cyanobacterium]TAG45602.1 MAG: biopolymer transporter ExbD [Oscillatoriales cyanobacterium]